MLSGLTFFLWQVYTRIEAQAKTATSVLLGMASACLQDDGGRTFEDRGLRCSYLHANCFVW